MEQQEEAVRINPEAYIETVSFSMKPPEALTSQEQDILARFLETKVAKKTFRLLSFDVEGLREGICMSDLENPSSVARALKLQGAAQGLNMALNTIIEIANGARNSYFPEEE